MFDKKDIGVTAFIFSFLFFFAAYAMYINPRNFDKYGIRTTAKIIDHRLRLITNMPVTRFRYETKEGEILESNMSGLVGEVGESIEIYYRSNSPHSIRLYGDGEIDINNSYLIAVVLGFISFYIGFIFRKSIAKDDGDLQETEFRYKYNHRKLKELSKKESLDLCIQQPEFYFDMKSISLNKAKVGDNCFALKYLGEWDCWQDAWGTQYRYFLSKGIMVGIEDGKISSFELCFSLQAIDDLPKKLRPLFQPYRGECEWGGKNFIPHPDMKIEEVTDLIGTASEVCTANGTSTHTYQVKGKKSWCNLVYNKKGLLIAIETGSEDGMQSVLERFGQIDKLQ